VDDAWRHSQGGDEPGVKGEEVNLIPFIPAGIHREGNLLLGGRADGVSNALVIVGELLGPPALDGCDPHLGDSGDVRQEDDVSPIVTEGGSGGGSDVQKTLETVSYRGQGDRMVIAARVI
jgi:hypothetical protein